MEVDMTSGLDPRTVMMEERMTGTRKASQVDNPRPIGTSRLQKDPGQLSYKRPVWRAFEFGAGYPGEPGGGARETVWDMRGE